MQQWLWFCKTVPSGIVVLFLLMCRPQIKWYPPLFSHKTMSWMLGVIKINHTTMTSNHASKNLILRTLLGPINAQCSTFSFYVLKTKPQNVVVEVTFLQLQNIQSWMPYHLQVLLNVPCVIQCKTLHNSQNFCSALHS